MEKIEIGKRWPGAMPGYDSPVFDYTPSGPILTLYMAQPTSKEIADAKAGKLRIGYYVKGCVLFLVFKLGSTWMDAPFSIRKHDGKGESFDWSEEIGDGQGLMLQMYLVDRATSEVKAIRVIGTSTEFAKGLRKEIINQLETTYSDSLYDSIINDVYRNLSSKDLADRAENIFTVR